MTVHKNGQISVVPTVKELSNIKWTRTKCTSVQAFNYLIKKKQNWH